MITERLSVCVCVLSHSDKGGKSLACVSGSTSQHSRHSRQKIVSQKRTTANSEQWHSGQQWQIAQRAVDSSSSSSSNFSRYNSSNDFIIGQQQQKKTEKETSHLFGLLRNQCRCVCVCTKVRLGRGKQQQQYKTWKIEKDSQFVSCVCNRRAKKKEKSYRIEKERKMCVRKGETAAIVLNETMTAKAE